VRGKLAPPVRERPILMRGELVRATFAGLKTETRRIVTPWPVRSLPHTKPLPDLAGSDGSWSMHHPLGWRWIPRPKQKNGVHIFGDDEHFPASLASHCRFGRAGDRLWVRETWAEPWGEGEGVFYRADGPPEGFESDGSWNPSILMPRRLCRLVLEIVEVRAERLQDLDDAGARAEGVTMTPFYPDDGFPLSQGFMLGMNDGKSKLYPTALAAFEAGWDAINGKPHRLKNGRIKPAVPWSSNPWVWVVKYKRLEEQ